MTTTCHTIKLVQKSSRKSGLRTLTLTRVYQLKYLGYLKLIGSGYNWCHWSPIRWDPCGALNLDVQDVYANGCTVNGTVHSYFSSTCPKLSLRLPQPQHHWAKFKGWIFCPQNPGTPDSCPTWICRFSPVADLGGARDACPLPTQNFFIFMQFFGKNWPDSRLLPPVGLAPPWEIPDPLLLTVTQWDVQCLWAIDTVTSSSKFNDFELFFKWKKSIITMNVCKTFIFKHQ